MHLSEEKDISAQSESDSDKHADVSCKWPN